MFVFDFIILVKFREMIHTHISVMATYSMNSANCALVLGNRRFPRLLFYQILLFRLYLRKDVKNLVINPQKSTFAKFKADFSCNFLNF